MVSSLNKIAKRSKYERIVAAEILSLVGEGYSVIINSKMLDGRTYIRLHNFRNKNTMVFKVSEDGYLQTKNGKILKALYK